MFPALFIAAFLLVGLLAAFRRVPLSYNVRNVTVRWRTTLLTALAFTLVISLLTVMLAFVRGMQKMTEGAGNASNVMVLADGATDEAFSNLDLDVLSDIENQRWVERFAGRPLASHETYMVVNQRVDSLVPGRPKRRFVQVRGLDDPLMTARVHEMPLWPGGAWFSNSGVQPLPGAEGVTAVQAVIGEGLAHELGRDRTPEQIAKAKNPNRLDVGDMFSLGNRMWIVVGVLRSGNSTFNSELWAKRNLAASIFGKTTYTTLVVRARSPAAAAEFKGFLVHGYRKAAVNPLIETDYYESLNKTNEQFLWAIGFIVVIMSIGGVFGVMNTMFAAISQRTKDIGVLRLLGYNRTQILICFLLESLVIAIVGGLLGCAIGSLAHGWQATSVVSSGTGPGKSVALTMTVDMNILALGMLLAFGMGLLGGLFPAVTAMRMRALEALR